MEVEIGAILLLVIGNRRFLSREGDGFVCVTALSSPSDHAKFS
jgi:hypothetical protein